MRKVVSFVVLLVCFCFPILVFGAEIESESTIVPLNINNHTYRLDAKIYKPVGYGPFPLIVINHGTARLKANRQELSADKSFKDHCEMFASKGYAVIAFIRRGFGKSEGVYAENNMNGSLQNYQMDGLEAAKDIQAAIEFMKTKPYVDGKRIILFGVSTGGHSVIATGSLNIDGVIGILNFAGGRGSYATDMVMDENSLVKSMGFYGKTSHIPTLWLYARNDHFFGPSVAKAMFEAYISSGGNAKFVQLPPFGSDGHYANDIRNFVNWAPYVEDFLTGLKVLDQKLCTMNQVEMMDYGQTEAAHDINAAFDVSQTILKEQFGISMQGYQRVFLAPDKNTFSELLMNECEMNQTDAEKSSHAYSYYHYNSISILDISSLPDQKNRFEKAAEIIWQRFQNQQVSSQVFKNLQWFQNGLVSYFASTVVEKAGVVKPEAYRQEWLTNLRNEGTHPTLTDLGTVNKWKEAVAKYGGMTVNSYAALAVDYLMEMKEKQSVSRWFDKVNQLTDPILDFKEIFEYSQINYSSQFETYLTSQLAKLNLDSKK